MEAIPTDLRKFLASQKPSLDCIRSISRQILVAVAYLHDNEITHRDLKPANILVSQDNNSLNGVNVKVADFGLSSRKAHMESFCGTAYYMAPEIHATRCLIHSYYGYMVDIWAVGIMIHEMLGGKVRLISRDPDQWIPIWAAPPRDEKKRQAFQLARKMLADDPRTRPTALQCLDDGWLTQDLPGPPGTPNLVNSIGIPGSSNLLGASQALASPAGPAIPMNQESAPEPGQPPMPIDPIGIPGPSNFPGASPALAGLGGPIDQEAAAPEQAGNAGKRPRVLDSSGSRGIDFNPKKMAK